MDTQHPLTAYRARNNRQTQEALGAEIGVTGVTVSRWETGQREIDVDLLPKVVEVTGIPARELRPDLAKLLEEPKSEETQCS